ncbi:MAG: asparagine synthase-related protein [Methanosarcina barkeri]|nr:asparagine synthase-related protein [Methanosarcina sp. ERenArc_MAG2]
MKAALEKAVEIRLTQASGIAFSGGIDSTFLAALAKKLIRIFPFMQSGFRIPMILLRLRVRLELLA